MFKRIAYVSLLTVGLIGAGLSVVRAEEEKKKEQDEVKVKIEQAPAAVQQTIKDESGGAAVAEVDKDTKDGKTSYEAHVQIKGKDYEIKVADDGTLISKALDDDKDEKGKDTAKEAKEEQDDKDQRGEHKD